MPKGDYYGPDKNKGVRPTGKDKYYGPNKFKGVAQKKKAAAPKVDKYQKQADELAKKQFAGTLTELQMGKESSAKLYADQAAQRKAALAGELASNQTAGAITENTVAGLKGRALAQFAKDKATQDALSAARVGQENAVNSDALTQYETDMKARGVDPSQVPILTAAMKSRQGYGTELDTIRNNASTSAEQRATQLYDMAAIQAQGQKNRTAGNASAAAQRDLLEQFNKYTARDAELGGTIAKTKLDEASTAANTALTLRKEAALRKQEKAQLALERHVAGLKNAESMAKVASSDYFKEAGLQLKAADLKLKGKALDAKIKKEQRDGNTAEAKLLETIRSNMARERTNDAKAGVKYSAPTPTNLKITSPSNPKK